LACRVGGRSHRFDKSGVPLSRLARPLRVLRMPGATIPWHTCASRGAEHRISNCRHAGRPVRPAVSHNKKTSSGFQHGQETYQTPAYRSGCESQGIRCRFLQRFSLPACCLSHCCRHCFHRRGQNLRQGKTRWMPGNRLQARPTRNGPRLRLLLGAWHQLQSNLYRFIHPTPVVCGRQSL
jgi:hypothetical protein